jgi:lipopolysaccharide/colanic/teichoic acid biosynthesis glycosyltransferase
MMEESTLHVASNASPAASSDDGRRRERSGGASRARSRAPGATSLPLDELMPITTTRETAAAFAAPAGATHEVAPTDAFAPAQRMEMLARVVNLVIAGIALLILAPVCVLVAIAVRITSPGPVFYTQTRVGMDRRWNRTNALHERRVEDLGGQPFTILKFRSMRVDAESNGQAVWATKHDARVTLVGRVLRKTRLDEIPQLINVLRGEMHVVGPRPERPSIVVRLRNEIPEYTLRNRVKPGITGWAQINHSYDSCIEDVRKKVRLDLEYIGKQSLWFDVKIMLLTVPVMLFRRGAH